MGLKQELENMIENSVDVPSVKLPVWMKVFSRETELSQMDPTQQKHLIERLTSLLEKEGSVTNVCFVEGMVWFKDHWLIYYGAGDSRIAVAECWE